MAIDIKFKSYWAIIRRIARLHAHRLKRNARTAHRPRAGLEENYVRWFEYYFPNFAKVPCAWFHKKMADDIVPATGSV